VHIIFSFSLPIVVIIIVISSFPTLTLISLCLPKYSKINEN
jgi:hypothetical protein